MSEEFREARQRLDDLRSAEEELLRQITTECDWSNPEDIAAYRAERRRHVRETLLERLVPDRRCPSCGQKRMRSRSWVVMRAEDFVVCRACFFRANSSVEREEGKPKRGEVFGAKMTEIRYPLSGEEFRRRREAICGEREFARRAGWSRAYQRRLESGRVKTVSEATKEVIETVFEEVEV